MGLSGLVLAVPLLPLDPMLPPSLSLLGLFELAIENTPESAWLAGESLLDASRGDSFVGWTEVALGLVESVVVAVATTDVIGSTRLGEYVGFPANSNEGKPDGHS